MLCGPIAITNTSSVGVVRDAIIAASIRDGVRDEFWDLPVVGETWDGWLNDMDRPGRHPRAPVRGARFCDRRHGRRGQRRRRHRHDLPRVQGRHRHRVSPRPAEQMAASRSASWSRRTTARRERLAIDGVQVGRALGFEEIPSAWDEASDVAGAGSIIVIVATDAPLLAHQCERVAQRAGLGIARAGGGGSNSSGDLFLCFATGNRNLGHTGRRACPHLQNGPDARRRAHHAAVLGSHRGDRGGHRERAGRRRNDGRTQRSDGARAAARSPAGSVGRRARTAWFAVLDSATSLGGEWRPRSCATSFWLNGPWDGARRSPRCWPAPWQPSSSAVRARRRRPRKRLPVARYPRSRRPARAPAGPRPPASAGQRRRPRVPRRLRWRQVPPDLPRSPAASRLVGRSPGRRSMRRYSVPATSQRSGSPARTRHRSTAPVARRTAPISSTTSFRPRMAASSSTSSTTPRQRTPLPTSAAGDLNKLDAASLAALGADDAQLQLAEPGNSPDIKVDQLSVLKGKLWFDLGIPSNANGKSQLLALAALVLARTGPLQ